MTESREVPFAEFEKLGQEAAYEQFWQGLMDDPKNKGVDFMNKSNIMNIQTHFVDEADAAIQLMVHGNPDVKLKTIREAIQHLNSYHKVVTVLEVNIAPELIDQLIGHRR